MLNYEAGPLCPKGVIRKAQKGLAALPKAPPARTLPAAGLLFVCWRGTVPSPAGSQLRVLGEAALLRAALEQRALVGAAASVGAFQTLWKRH